jgi:glycosyltransferase involved in cell wall biosynthesis
MDKVSVVIPTYNRFNFLLNTIKSVKEQTYSNIEIIVVNDCSAQKEYYEYDWKENNIIIIHLETNSKQKFGFACAGFVRNTGIELASGKYIAFCDDDDIWFPNKLDLQIKAMKETGCKLSSTEALYGEGVYDSTKKYQRYLAERYYKVLRDSVRSKGSNLLDNGYPTIMNLYFAKLENCMICSSVMIEKEILDKINNFKTMKPPGEDYDCWQRALEHTNNVYVKEPCVYYDGGHGYGQNW